jgi:hypothetical protein
LNAARPQEKGEPRQNRRMEKGESLDLVGEGEGGFGMVVRYRA